MSESGRDWRQRSLTEEREKREREQRNPEREEGSLMQHQEESQCPMTETGRRPFFYDEEKCLLFLLFLSPDA